MRTEDYFRSIYGGLNGNDRMVCAICRDSNNKMEMFAWKLNLLSIVLLNLSPLLKTEIISIKVLEKLEAYS